MITAEGTRVEVPSYTDAWMRGDRFGEVIKYNARNGMLTVKLDKSGRERGFRVADCRVVD